MMLTEHWRQWRRQATRGSSIVHLLIIYAHALLVNDQQPLRGSHSKYSFHYWFPQINVNHLRPLDPIRMVIQLLWLMLFKGPSELPDNTVATQSRFRRSVTHYKNKALMRYKSLRRLLLPIKRWQRRISKKTIALSAEITWAGGWVLYLTLAVILIGLGLIITIPMATGAQVIMLLAFWSVAMWVRDIPGRIPMMLMMIISITVSTRYIWWRVTHTLNWDSGLNLTLGLLLLAAELYAWTILILGYIQTAWPLQRKVAQLPADTSLWPSVDVYIPTYNEPLHVVRNTILAAQQIEWPQEKLNIYVLDDGKRADFKAFCAEVGVGYLIRPNNYHAKAGNLNHALTQTSGEYITIFDCDHIPTRSFLQLTVGWFLRDPKLALLQTPHHFFSPDPFEKNLNLFRSRPNEGELFYGLIQDGNDLWNASFFCGSCAVLKRGPLEEVGGIAVETVTEDAHTALKLHRRGYSSAYLNIPQAAGLATETLAAHIGQRMRWARGMAQIFRIDNPLRGKGLNWGQRLCYLNAMLYFLNGLPRLIFLTAPLAFLLLGSYLVFAPAIMIAAYALPHIIHANLTNSRTQGRFRNSFWAEMYETVLAWYIFRPTTVALFAPHKGKFNVTAKGGLTERSFFDWKISVPYVVLVAMSFTGLGFGIWRLAYGPEDQFLTVILNLLWVFYNLIILGGAVAVAEEARQVRVAHRIAVQRPTHVLTKGGHRYHATLVDYSEHGVALTIKYPHALAIDEVFQFTLTAGERPVSFRARVISVRDQSVGAILLLNTLEEQRNFVGATFSRADAWLGWRDADNLDQPIRSLREVVAIGLRGYQRMAKQFVPFLEPIFVHFQTLWLWLTTLLPQRPGSRGELL
ncbi:UDP-forming cellulose synthase catalytic subunit [Idiomarina tyrosinivorans]|uniref:Cellulose synthase catalytic subunit [UDP-forming] n=1 Tax=Idiomarina tyrosinivorans TaxID=1445662 RepID=A0A432ZSE8_9GAMM|nr:UDP-forming cellulose synthase catalytic subunit [Idiomarina tyrosinivorans]RUO80817.1 UDP-forming cellulose synthase catalytic subunit [Idiomarina tyrosinivorans]